MKTDFTPGPWRVIKKQSRVGYADYEVAWSDYGELVCDVVYHEGDANLIAAAPDLFAALIEVLDKIPLTDSGRFETPTAAKARAAVAKALGQESRPDQDDTEDEICCPACDGSGEGLNDGTTCPVCKGRGELRSR